MNEKQKFMQIAVNESEKFISNNISGPFGACIVRGGEIISKAHNQVVQNNDPTCHAEINAIRKACRKLKTYDLSGCELYSSSMPCPMCLAAAHWAKISVIYYSADSKSVAKIGFADDDLHNSFKTGNFKKMKIIQIPNDAAIDVLKKYPGTIY